MFQPVIPLTGNSGWKFLQSTYDRQLKASSDSAQVRNDREYMAAKLSKPITTEEFVKDSRLLRVTMTAFGLGGEEWKKGFVNKVLKEVQDPESTFLKRLNNAKYTAFAEALSPVDGVISVSADTITEIAEQFNAESFETAVGDVDENMRLSLNYKTEIGKLAKSTSSDEAILYKILGDTPVFTVVQQALNLPSEMTNLEIEQQANILKQKLQSALGIQKMSELSSSDKIDKMITRYHAMVSIAENASVTSPAATALTLLSNSSLGSQGSRNLFQSLL